MLQHVASQIDLISEGQTSEISFEYLLLNRDKQINHNVMFLSYDFYPLQQCSIRSLKYLAIFLFKLPYNLCAKYNDKSLPRYIFCIFFHTYFSLGKNKCQGQQCLIIKINYIIFAPAASRRREQLCLQNKIIKKMEDFRV